MNHQAFYEIFVCNPMRFLKEVRINELMPIGCLDGIILPFHHPQNIHLDDENMKCDSQSKGNINCCFEKDNSSINPTFIFKGMILDRKKSFKFYNIGKGDVIMAIEKNKFTQKINFFLKTYDYDEFKNRLIQIKDRSFRRELSRIIDQKVTLKEDYLIRSAFSKRKSTLYKKDPNQSQIKIEDYSKNTEPSVDPLPLFIF